MSKILNVLTYELAVGIGDGKEFRSNLKLIHGGNFAYPSRLSDGLDCLLVWQAQAEQQPILDGNETAGAKTHPALGKVIDLSFGEAFRAAACQVRKGGIYLAVYP